MLMSHWNVNWDISMHKSNIKISVFFLKVMDWVFKLLMWVQNYSDTFLYQAITLLQVVVFNLVTTWLCVNWPTELLTLQNFFMKFKPSY